MKITIEIDSATLAVAAADVSHVENTLLSGAVALDRAMEAGACAGLPGEREAKNTATTAGGVPNLAKPPSPHADTFGLWDSQSENAISVGSPVVGTGK